MPNDQNNSPNENTYRQLSFYIIGVILIACIIFRLIFHWNTTSAVIHKFCSTISPFFIGGLIAYMVNPLCNYFSNRVFPNILKNTSKKTNKILSILLAYVILLGLLIVGLMYIIPQLISSLLELTDTIPVTILNVSAWLTQMTKTVPFVNQEMINQLTNTIFPNMLSKTTELISTMIPILYSMSLSVIHWIINFLISIVISIYVLSDKNLLARTGKKILYSFVSEEKCIFILSTLHECNNIFSGFIIGKLIDSTIIGILCFISMSILQLPYSMLVSVIVGVTNMIPYFGPFIGGIIGSIFLILLSFKSGLIFVVLVIILQQFDGLILGPKILGDSTGVRPLGILFAITVGGAYAGVLGMFLGVPIFAVLQYLLSMLIDNRLETKQIEMFNKQSPSEVEEEQEKEKAKEKEAQASEKLRQVGSLLSGKFADSVKTMRKKTDEKAQSSSAPDSNADNAVDSPEEKKEDCSSSIEHSSKNA